MSELRSVLVTGAAGYIGGLVVRALAGRRSELSGLVALDVREPPPSDRLDGVVYVNKSVCDATLADVLAEHHVDTIVHLASILKPPKNGGEDLAYQVDVEGTRNVLASALKHRVKKLIVTTSGAAYGYHPDSPSWLTEADPIRGNEEIAYSRHKRLIENDLERYRRDHPELGQLVFRPGTVIGAGVSTPVTELFEAKLMVGVAGSNSPFVFIWDQDVVECIVRGVFGPETGIYNLAGDGALSPQEIAARLGKSPYGPEQVKFLRYRPVLSNRALKERFGYTPQKTSREAFELYALGVAAR